MSNLKLKMAAALLQRANQFRLFSKSKFGTLVIKYLGYISRLPRYCGLIGLKNSHFGIHFSARVCVICELGRGMGVSPLVCVINLNHVTFLSGLIWFVWPVVSQRLTRFGENRISIGNYFHKWTRFI